MVSFQAGLCGCSEVLAPWCCSISSSAWLPWRLVFEFPSKDFCPLILPRGQQQPVSHLFDWHTILCWLQRELCPCPKSMSNPELSHFAEAGWAVLQRAGAGIASLPIHTHCQELQPRGSTLGSTTLHTQTPVFP